MALASSKTPPSVKPPYDLSYTLQDSQFDPHRDSQFLFRRTKDVMLQEGAVAGGRTLDVGCGVGNLAMGLRQHGTEAWGIEPSREMLGMGRWLFPADQIVLVRGIGEVLAFRDGSFDRVTCRGALDHFVDPHAFMREAARVLRPEGRVVIALANFESLSCRLGRFRERLVRPFLRNGRPRRVYWEVHYDHYHKGELSFVQQLGGNWLQLERCYGLSLFWQFPRWGALLDHLPAPAAKGLWLSLDRIAYRAPSMADMIISVWRRYPAAGEARRQMSEQAGRGQGGSANPLP